MAGVIVVGYAFVVGPAHRHGGNGAGAPSRRHAGGMQPLAGSCDTATRITGLTTMMAGCEARAESSCGQREWLTA